MSVTLYNLLLNNFVFDECDVSVYRDIDLNVIKNIISCLARDNLPEKEKDALSRGLQQIIGHRKHGDEWYITIKNKNNGAGETSNIFFNDRSINVWSSIESLLSNYTPNTHMLKIKYKIKTSKTMSTQSFINNMIDKLKPKKITRGNTTEQTLNDLNVLNNEQHRHIMNQLIFLCTPKLTRNYTQEQMDLQLQENMFLLFLSVYNQFLILIERELSVIDSSSSSNTNNKRQSRHPTATATLNLSELLNNNTKNDYVCKNWKLIHSNLSKLGLLNNNNYVQACLGIWCFSGQNQAADSDIKENFKLKDSKVWKLLYSGIQNTWSKLVKYSSKG